MREPPWLSLLGTCFLVLIRMELARLREVWYELEINGSTNQDELQRWLVSLRENPRQYKSIFGFTKGHDGGLRASVERDHQSIAQDRLFSCCHGVDL